MSKAYYPYKFYGCYIVEKMVQVEKERGIFPPNLEISSSKVSITDVCGLTPLKVQKVNFTFPYEMYVKDFGACCYVKHLNKNFSRSRKTTGEPNFKIVHHSILRIQFNVYILEQAIRSSLSI